MSSLIRKRTQKIGQPPGTLVHIGAKKTDKVGIRIIGYSDTQFQEKEAETVEECLPFKDKPTVTWINIDGVHQVEMIEKIGKYFDLHPLLLEDIVNTEQRPKMEDFEDHLFIVLKMLSYREEENEIMAEQISLILSSEYVISFQETVQDVFNPIRERIRKGKGRVRKRGPDYLAYTLIDTVIDNYFVILEKLGEKIEDIEEELVTDPTQETLHLIYDLKKAILFLRKSIWPLREVVSGLERGESELIQEHTRIYLRDVYDHTIQVIDTIETFRDMLSGMLDIYLSSISNRMNEVMKVLTIIATIFIPLTLIAGIYGMNFRYMPELEWSWGYPMVWLIMLAVGVSMLIYFRRKKML